MSPPRAAPWRARRSNRTRGATLVAFSLAALPAASRDARADGPPDRGISVTARGAYDFPLLGKVGRTSITDAFDGGPDGELDAGFIFARGLSVYVGWEQAFLGVGPKNAYAKLPTVGARDDVALLGIRFLSADSFGFAGQLDGGYNILHAQGSDAHGGSATAEFHGLHLRLGLGLNIRPTRWMTITPNCLLAMTLPLTYGGSVTLPHAAPTPTTGKANGDPQLSVLPGLALGGEIPL